MTCTALDGNGTLQVTSWTGERDDDGHRTFTLVTRVESDDINDGPLTVMQCPDLPQVGTLWILGNDSDSWAFCWPTMKISPQRGAPESQPTYLWRVEQKFSTKPMKRCNISQVANPLSEPFLISGSFQKYTREVSFDRFGAQIRSSSMEQLHGPGVEFDFNRGTVKIAWNVSNININNLATYIDTVNDSTLWGFPARCVKLSNISYERVLYGVCTFYYKQNLEFDTDWNTFDRFILDEGHKVLNGTWAQNSADPKLLTYRAGVPLPTGSLWKLLPVDGGPPDRTNPQHYIRYKDKNGEMNRVVLDGNGEPAAIGDPFIQPSSSSALIPGGAGTPGQIFVSYYPQSNFLALGVPSSL